MGDKDLLPLPSELGAVLEGSYRSYSCLYFSCSTVDITFTANGRFKLDSFRIASSPADGSFWGSTWSGTGSGTVGTYAVGPHSVTLTPDQGNAHTAFLFRDFHLLSATADRLQIGELWFSRR